MQFYGDGDVNELFQKVFANVQTKLANGSDESQVSVGTFYNENQQH